MKKIFAALVLAGSLAAVGTAPAMATTYPAPDNCVVVSDATVATGETFVLSGNCFAANETITITLTLTAAPQAISGGAGGASMAVPSKISVPMAPQTFTTTADSNGDFTFPMQISDPGTYTLTATGNTSRVSDSATVTVVAAASAPLANTGGAPLANTGADASLLLWGAAGVGALGLGAAGVIIVRRNKNQASA
ncbi:LPXTG cell wall anchor domain-containing protein [Arthrobacter sp. AB6]|uniref:LPXTG cell wall anchor domain-containing protein n=1 Tax=Arthrobacter sp. AB6 TaxID=2962570 RepID=UPI0028812729|nr:LPXTG cell wall anchor domain-containing protein [Arthrobacter sp. AB6]MDT0193812.1 LPXTG cell wall anchor domain-containing protein [Arthrobacter sp. AB6]